MKLLVNFFMLFLLLSFCAQAQKRLGSGWGDGMLALLDETEYVGKISYDLGNNTVQIKQNDKILSFSASKVEYFEVFDVDLKYMRQFYSLPHSNSTDYKALIFFELLAEGKLTLLNREHLEERLVTRPGAFGYYAGSTMIEYILVNNYYILDDSGQVRAYDPDKDHLFELFYPYKVEMLNYGSANKLSTSRKFDLIELFTRYNQYFPSK